MDDPQSRELRPFCVALRITQTHSTTSERREEPVSLYFKATTEVIATIAKDFTGNPTAGVYNVLSRNDEPVTLALRFEDVLYIG